MHIYLQFGPPRAAPGGHMRGLQFQRCLCADAVDLSDRRHLLGKYSTACPAASCIKPPTPGPVSWVNRSNSNLQNLVSSLVATHRSHLSVQLKNTLVEAARFERQSLSCRGYASFRSGHSRPQHRKRMVCKAEERLVEDMLALEIRDELKARGQPSTGTASILLST